MTTSYEAEEPTPTGTPPEVFESARVGSLTQHLIDKQEAQS